MSKYRMKMEIHREGTIGNVPYYKIQVKGFGGWYDVTNPSPIREEIECLFKELNEINNENTRRDHQADQPGLGG